MFLQNNHRLHFQTDSGQQHMSRRRTYAGETENSSEPWEKSQIRPAIPLTEK
jgi:hypothetical protein